jgi:hypothetical protein
VGINHLNFFIAFYFTVFVDSFLFAINGLLVTGGISKLGSKSSQLHGL